MSYEEFLQQIELRVKKRIGKEVRTRIIPVLKNNSVKLDSLSILEQGNHISPAIYLNGYYREYLSGTSMDVIIARIMGCYYRGKRIGNLDTSFFTETEKMKTHVVCRLINFEKNKKILDEVPHRIFLNLAIVYYCVMEHETIGMAAVLIRREHLGMWGIDEKTLHDAAVRNTKRMLPWDFRSMSELINSMMNTELFQDSSQEVPLFVLSNKDKSFGAVWMTDAEILEKIGEKLKDNYYILPSSVHECLIVPAAVVSDERMLLEMVQEINETQVEPEEVLADAVYQYDRGQKNLSVLMQV